MVTQGARLFSSCGLAFFKHGTQTQPRLPSPRAGRKRKREKDFVWEAFVRQSLPLKSYSLELSLVATPNYKEGKKIQFRCVLRKKKK